MNFLSHPLVARLLWVFPLLLLAIAVYLVWAGQEQREVASIGTQVEAEVVEVFMRERSEITRGEVSLRFVPPGQTEPVERTIEVPLAFLKSIEARELETIPIRFQEVGGQIVLEPYSRPQWILTFSLAAMAFIGALGFGVLVFGWNRYLARHGDPAALP